MLHTLTSDPAGTTPGRSLMQLYTKNAEKSSFTAIMPDSAYTSFIISAFFVKS